MKRTSFFLFAFLASAPALAQQSQIDGYNTARDQYFWNRLYPMGGVTVYCSHVFPSEQVRRASGGPRVSDAGERLSVEHAYPADWMAEANGCPNRNQCDVSAYRFAEADLHNLWPALGRINSSRSDLPLNELPGEAERRFETICPDFERSSGSNAIVEPQDAVKGDLARSQLYMMVSYGLPLHGSLETLAAWHQEDPPDDVERARNSLIEQFQGTRNPFIDYPEVILLLELE